MYRYLFFDLDGTLTDSKEGILNCLRYAFEKLGEPTPDEETLLQFIGPPLQESFARYCGFSPERALEGLRLFRERYVPIGKLENAPAPGMAELLDRLKEPDRDDLHLLLKAAPEEGRVLLSGVPGVAEVAPLPCGEAGAALLRLTPAEGADPREAVFRACAGADLPILEMRRESLSLEQIFLELTSDASAAGQAGGRRRPFGRRDSAEPEPAPETAITEHGEEAEP